MVRLVAGSNEEEDLMREKEMWMPGGRSGCFV